MLALTDACMCSRAGPIAVSPSGSTMATSASGIAGDAEVGGQLQQPAASAVDIEDNAGFEQTAVAQVTSRGPEPDPAAQAETERQKRVVEDAARANRRTTRRQQDSQKRSRHRPPSKQLNGVDGHAFIDR